MRPPSREDGARIHRLITDSPPLDVNSVYLYLLLCEHFADTCIVADAGEHLDGFISAYRVPSRPETLFVWQVAVHERARGQGLAKRMLRSLLERPGMESVRYIETTVGPDNAASRAMFTGFAASLSAPIEESNLFEVELFGAQGHEAEPMLRIGPFRTSH